MDWSYNTLSEVADLKFNNFRSAQLAKNLRIYAGDNQYDDDQTDDYIAI